MDFNVLSNDIAIDLGSSNTRIYIKGKGLVLDEPSILAYDSTSGEIIACGSEAYDMQGRTPPSVTVVYPLSDGVISDCFFAEELLKSFLHRVCQKTLIKPRIMMAIPCEATDVERRALRDAAVVAGARKVYIMESPLAAAIGSGCDISLARGLMIADLGGGAFDIAAISLGQCAASTSLKLAGNVFTDALNGYIRDTYSLMTGFISTERCKTEIGCVFSGDHSKNFTIAGSDVASGLPKSIIINSEETKDAFDSVCTALSDAIRATLDKAPAELVGDIMEDGILLTGGAAKMNGLVTRLKIDTGIKIFQAPNSELCVVRGLAAAIESIDKLPADSYTIYQG